VEESLQQELEKAQRYLDMVGTMVVAIAVDQDGESDQPGRVPIAGLR